MIKKFIIGRNKDGAFSLELELRKPNLTGIYIKNVEGLGYPSSNIPVTQLALSDIAYFNHSLFDTRNIVFTFAFVAGVNVEEKRDILRRAFPAKEEIKIGIITDIKNVYALGYVENFDSDIFSKTETVQVSILCPNPYFMNNEGTKVEGYGKPIAISSDKRIDNGLKIYIRNSVSGIDNFRMTYAEGSLYFGSGVLRDPSLFTEANISEKNFIKPTDTLFIDTSIDTFGIYLVRSDGVSENFTNKVRLVGDYPMVDNIRENSLMYPNSYAFGISDEKKQYEFKKRTKFAIEYSRNVKQGTVEHYSNLDIFNGKAYSIYAITTNMNELWKYTQNSTESGSGEGDSPITPGVKYDGDRLILAVHETLKVDQKLSFFDVDEVISPDITSLFGEIIIDRPGDEVLIDTTYSHLVIGITTDFSINEIPDDFEIKLLLVSNLSGVMDKNVSFLDISDNQYVQVLTNNCYIGESDPHDQKTFLQRIGTDIKTRINRHDGSKWKPFTVSSLYKKDVLSTNGWFNEEVSDNTSYVVTFDNYIEGL